MGNSIGNPGPNPYTASATNIPASRSISIVGLILICIGALLRLYQADYSLDGDEIFSISLARKSFGEMIAGSLQDRPHPPLHNILLYAWVHAFGASEVAARSLSALLSVGFLALAFRLFKRVVPDPVAVCILAILALSPLFVYFGQQARPYSLITFLTAANFLAFLDLLNNPQERRTLLVWAGTCVALLHAQYLGLLVILLEMAISLAWLRQSGRQILYFGTAACLAIAPWFIAAMWPSLGTQGDPLYHIAWIKTPTAYDLIWMYVSIFGSPPDVQVRWLLIALSIPVIFYVGGRKFAGRIGPVEAFLLLAAFVLPAVVAAVSIWGPKPIFASRQLLGSCLAVVALLGFGLAAMPRMFAYAIVAGLVVWLAASLHEAVPRSSKPPWQAVVEELSRPGTKLPLKAVEGWVTLPIEYYRPELAIEVISEADALGQKSEYLLLCRASKCSPIDTPTFEGRRTLLKKWRWGRVDQISLENTLVLYRIANPGASR